MEIQILKMVGYFLIALATTSVSTITLLYKHSSFVANMNDVFKNTTEFSILATYDITAKFRILLTSGT